MLFSRVQCAFFVWAFPPAVLAALQQPPHAIAKSTPRPVAKASAHAPGHEAVPRPGVAQLLSLYSCADSVDVRVVRRDLVSHALVAQAICSPTASLAVCDFPARSDVARSRPWPPGCREWRSQIHPDAQSRALWTWQQLLLGKLADCPYRVHRRSALPNQQFVDEASRKLSPLARDAVHDGRLGLG